MTVKLLAGNDVLLEQEYYSVGGGFIEWKGYTPPKKNPPKYPFRLMKELRGLCRQTGDINREGDTCQRDVYRGQDGRGGLCLHRQDHQRHGRYGEVRPIDAGG